MRKEDLENLRLAGYMEGSVTEKVANLPDELV